MKDIKNIAIQDVETRYGGNATTASVCIYDTLDALKYAEPQYRQIRTGVIPEIKKNSRKATKSAKNKEKKRFGTHTKKDSGKK